MIQRRQINVVELVVLVAAGYVVLRVAGPWAFVVAVVVFVTAVCLNNLRLIRREKDRR